MSRIMDCGRMMEAPRSLCRFPLRVRPSAMSARVEKSIFYQTGEENGAQ